jgi:HD-GYP domain-containing protein (c-di-GMP phosphodiesterase class II)
MMATALLESQNVLKDIDEWQEMKKEVQDSSRTSPTTPDYESFNDDAFNPINKEKKKEEFRNYENSARQQRVTKFYTIQHEMQSYEFVEKMHEKYLPRLYAQDKSKGLWMSVWEALEYLNQIVDDSDPDTNLPQIQHALQTAEAIREKWPEEEFDWFPLVGLIHDLGKIIAVSDKTLGLKLIVRRMVSLNGQLLEIHSQLVLLSVRRTYFMRLLKQIQISKTQNTILELAFTRRDVVCSM